MKAEFFKLNKRKKKVLYLSTFKLTGVAYHRLYQPAKILNNGDDYEITIIDDLAKLKDRELKKYQFCFTTTLFKDDVYIKLKKLGVPLVIDVDDLWWCEKYWYLYLTWQYNQNAMRVQRCILLADAVITSTEYLADFIRNINKEVHVIPNGINPEERQWTRQLNHQEFTRFGFIGSVSHISDMPLLKGPIARLDGNMELAEKWQLVLGGFSMESQGFSIDPKTGQPVKQEIPLNQRDWVRMEGMFTNNWRVIKGKHYNNYRELLGKFKEEEIPNNIMPYRRIWAKDVNNYAKMFDEIDVLLIPLVDDQFNRCKSPLKVIEAAFKKKAVICNDVIPYAEFTDRDLVYKVEPRNDAVGFFNGMREAINEPQKRIDRTEALYEYVKKKYNLIHITETRKELYDMLTDKFHKS